jgi:hypothetical protein
MKSSSKRLGRGLGSFLDFGPADEDGTARVERVIASQDATSVLETSAQSAARRSPPPTPAKPAAAVAPRVAVAPAPVAPPPPPAASAPPAPAPAAPALVVDDALFIDDVVEGIAFPDVELE